MVVPSGAGESCTVAFAAGAALAVPGAATTPSTRPRFLVEVIFFPLQHSTKQKV